MKTVVLLGACALMTSFAVDAGTNPAGRPTGLDRAITRMNAQGLAHSQASQHAIQTNPATRPTPPSGTIPAVPATPAVPPTAPGGSATPAVPATPAKPVKPPKDD